MTTNRPKRLGEILIEEKVLKAEDLHIALDIQKKEGGLLGEILVRRGLVSEEDVTVALSKQLGYRYLPVSSFVLNDEALKMIPVELLVEHDCLPVDKIEGNLAVVMADPSNKFAVKALEKAARCRIQAFVGTVSEIHAAIQRCYGRDPAVEKKSAQSGLSGVLREAAEKRKKELG